MARKSNASIQCVWSIGNTLFDSSWDGDSDDDNNDNDVVVLVLVVVGVFVSVPGTIVVTSEEEDNDDVVVTSVIIESPSLLDVVCIGTTCCSFWTDVVEDII